MNAHPRHPGVTWAHITAELARELDRRRATYPALVAKGNMATAEAAWHVEVVEAMAADAARFAATGPGLAPPPPAHGFSWHDRRHTLRRELDLRARHYPQWIAKGSLTAAQAARQCAALEALLAVYEDGVDWLPREGTRPAGSLPTNRDEYLWKREFDQTFFPIMAARGMVDPTFLATELARRYPELEPMAVPESQEALAL